MSRFDIGQKVVCVRPTGPYFADIPVKIQHSYGPKFNEILTVSAINFHHMKYWLEFVEYRQRVGGYYHEYNEIFFEPLAEITEIQEILSAEPITEKV